MPVVACDYNELVRLMGRNVPKEDLVARVPMMGGAYDGEDANGNLLFEFFPNRPDLLSIEGLARACRAFFDIQPGLPPFVVEASAEVVNVEPSVATVRPVIGFARVSGLSIDDRRLADLIELQERLTVGPGRKRRKVAIGIHDAAPVRAPYTYKAVGRRDVTFVPLGWSREATPEEILRDHEKGRLYAPLLEGSPKVPIIVDATGQVLSLPPVINGQLTALTTKTRDVLVDVTGTDERAVMGLLSIVVTSLAERGGKIHGMKLKTGAQSVVTPDLSPIQTDFRFGRAKELLGIDVDRPSAKKYLGRMGHDLAPKDEATGIVRSPPYRLDILHPDDIVEDLGIGYGFERFLPRLPERALFGGLLPKTRTTRRVRTQLLGLGFSEVVTLSITGRRDVFELPAADPTPVVSIANPLTLDQAIIRPRLLPSLLGLLRANKHRELPQSIFEIGQAIPNPGDPKVELRVAAVRTSATANFSECKGLVEAVLRDLGIQADVARGGAPGLAEGRAAVLRDARGVEVGAFGEVRPDVVTAFELGAPVIAFELILPTTVTR